MKDALAEYDLKVRYNDDPDGEPIDFIIYDDEDNVAWVWGSEPFNDVQVECNHPAYELEDEEPTAHCPICGATCDCHYEKDEGSVEDYHWSGRQLVPDNNWVMPKTIGGIVGKYLKELQERW